ncbi:E3 ubiquitin-protein ligase SIRP1-like [Oryza brachyantha]|uniref:RING-type E3 ubiquitin transferase n=1 Tax=Oryza brachyantha TaxID=4533 RepID=J3LNC7_ORYBR|nr:E3 ubiquitin-protein ligase SIRP1-like [Oryza brachyantha]
MEEEPSGTCRYFCYRCSLIVRPEVGIEEVQCPHCHSGFVEEMAGAEDDGRRSGNAVGGRRAAGEENADDDATRALPPWAPMLIDLLGVSSRRHGLDDDGSGDLAAFARRQYRNIALLQLLSALQDDDEAGGGDTPTNSGREQVVLVSSADARAMLTDGNGAGVAAASGFTLGDLFLGPGLDLLLDYLADADPNRQGTPPAKKEAVAALPTVRVHDAAATCPVCLDEFEAGGEAREMPCKHRFHDGCILPWLEAHSSCPVCRYQLPTDEPTAGNAIAAEGGGGELIGNARGGGDGESSGRRRWLSWPFGGLFSHRSSGSSSSS